MTVLAIAVPFFLLMNLPLNARATRYSSQFSTDGFRLNIFLSRRACICASLHSSSNPGIDRAHNRYLGVDIIIASAMILTSNSTWLSSSFASDARV